MTLCRCAPAGLLGCSLAACWGQPAQNPVCVHEAARNAAHLLKQNPLLLAMASALACYKLHEEV
eukprot:1136170-Pelagomonas_calceolata.AAC.11